MTVLKIFRGVKKNPRSLLKEDSQGLWETLFLLDDTHRCSFRMALLFV